MLRVIANEGLKVPFEKQRAFIGSEPVDVPDSLYYRRRLETGELVHVTDDATRKPSASALVADSDAATDKKSGSNAK
ncbi:DUF2635 domain-containing protein [Luteibacter aegosomatis]|uniref:DUF2635 domain-containing protein n=1 Tax=Luteibacter aegosomatis TaxID=2911537 RepID=UPI001FF858DD|nr:DUF2635 domain-containing protein [Luteibacter aegosomatis]UPG87027.1 DUF2635 domain-containing protein [Luteibacter aegosomatis]